MAFKRKFRSKKRTFKKRSFKKRFTRKPRTKRVTKKGNIATSTETIDLGTFTAVTDSGATAANFAYVTPSDFDRSSLVAVNYRFYRVTKVTYDYMPEANLYQAGAPTVPMVPRFISVMCRDANFNGGTSAAAGTLGDLEQMGGKFRQFTKPIKISYTPNIVLTTGAIAGATGLPQAGMYITRKKMPWLSTVTEGTASPVNSGLNWDHFGHQWAIVCDSFTSGQIMGRLKVTAHFEFKLPLANDTIVAKP